MENIYIDFFVMAYVDIRESAVCCYAYSVFVCWICGDGGDGGGAVYVSVCLLQISPILPQAIVGVCVTCVRQCWTTMWPLTTMIHLLLDATSSLKYSTSYFHDVYLVSLSWLCVGG